MRRLISTGSPMEREAGYSRAVIDGDWVFVAGTTGYNYDTMEISDDVAQQTRECFANIAAALAEVDAGLEDVVRVTYYLVDRGDIDTVVPIFGQFFGDVRPAATLLVVAGLADEKMKIEIEVTAHRLPRVDRR